MAAEYVQVSSAGLGARPGVAMHPDSAAALRNLGVDGSGHAAAPFTTDMAASADIILTFSRRQRAELMGAAPRAMRRTFTLTEAAHLLRVADMAGLADAPLSERAAVLAERLDAARAQRPDDADDDVPDPIQEPTAVHVAVVGQIADALRPLAEILFRDPAWPGTSSSSEQLRLTPSIRSRR